mmetsp:Transcript_44724/g.95119  ORF Transcript_44724/g.95119 Transcript_44724/m.95119 type:complete len:174 (-) Transcript_44724:265-786(-)|eukprot:CAMPEP_0183360458 /NCGR_PEP_ID=MMETSP0164_2-20130417/55245_1 /TAXON_ID=221442 /ORGANISM="Coccolithus pelagicus ssp braarudi, Strain PLY182g" /LENGTH=173 /DNA_ID=CAMNT_0025534823 /DNA_START=94 /DNA_END=615 /DNA_ORIENTATION=-
MSVDATDPELIKTFKDVCELKTKTNWVVYDFVEDPDKPGKFTKKLEVGGSGEGGHPELMAALKEDRVQFGGLLVVGVDHRDNVTSHRPKFVACTWIGPKVKVMAKARVSVQKREVFQKVFDPAGGISLEIDVSDADDFDKVSIAKALLKSGGAHKPTHYDFGDGEEYDLKQLD